MSRDLLTMVEVLAHEKNVDQSVVLAALESASVSYTHLTLPTTA